MPFKSDAQRRYMNWAAEHGKISKKTVNEFNEASKGLKLPERVKKYNGGIINNMKKHDGLPGFMAHAGMTGKSLGSPNHRVFPPAGVKFAKGGFVPSLGDKYTEEKNNAGVSEEYAGKDEFAEGGGENDEQNIVDCPMCGYSINMAYGGQVQPFGGDESDQEEMMEHEMLPSSSNVSKKAVTHQSNPDHQRRRALAAAIKRHRG